MHPAPNKQAEYEVEQRPRSGNRKIWALLVVLGALIAGAVAGFRFSEQRNVAALQAYFEQMTQLVLQFV